MFVALLRAVPSTEKQKALAREAVDVLAPMLYARRPKGGVPCGAAVARPPSAM